MRCIFLSRRDLRLAPGLAAVGFTEDAVMPKDLEENVPSTVPSRNHDTSSITPGLGVGDNCEYFSTCSDKTDRVLYALEALCRGPKVRGRCAEQASPSSASVANVRPGQGVILLTRIGGAWDERPADHVNNEDSGDGLGGGSSNTRSSSQQVGGLLAGVSAKLPWRTRTENTSAIGTASCLGGADRSAKPMKSLRALRQRESATVRRLRRFWRILGDQQAGILGVSGGRGCRMLPPSREVVLHACAGPGVLRAVKESMSEARASALGLSALPNPMSSSQFLWEPLLHKAHPVATSRGINDGMENGQDELAGVACRLPGLTVAALGSLRKHGAYCVVELAMPAETKQGGVRAGQTRWSVASVNFGRIDVPSLEVDGDQGVRVNLSV